MGCFMSTWGKVSHQQQKHRLRIQYKFASYSVQVPCKSWFHKWYVGNQNYLFRPWLELNRSQQLWGCCFHQWEDFQVWDLWSNACLMACINPSNHLLEIASSNIFCKWFLTSNIIKELSNMCKLLSNIIDFLWIFVWFDILRILAIAQELYNMFMINFFHGRNFIEKHIFNFSVLIWHEFHSDFFMRCTVMTQVYLSERTMSKRFENMETITNDFVWQDDLFWSWLLLTEWELSENLHLK